MQHPNVLVQILVNTYNKKECIRFRFESNFLVRCALLHVNCRLTLGSTASALGEELLKLGDSTRRRSPRAPPDPFIALLERSERRVIGKLNFIPHAR